MRLIQQFAVIYLFLTGSFLFMLPRPTFAEELVAKEDVSLVKGAEAADGYEYVLTGSLGGNWSESTDVISQINGITTTYNLKLEYSSLWRFSTAEWEHSLTLSETVTRTPTIPRNVKTGDDFKFVSFYKHFLAKSSRYGAYARLSIESPLLETYDERATQVEYVRTYLDGSASSEFSNRLRLSAGGRPMTVKEGVGAVAKLLTDKAASMEFRTGPAAKQYLAGGQWTLSDNPDTASVEVTEQSYLRTVGVEAALECKGSLAEETWIYKVYAEALYPLESSVELGEGQESRDSISTEVGLNLTYRLAKWLELTYNGKSKREPLLQSKKQVTQTFLAMVTLHLGTKKAEK